MTNSFIERRWRITATVDTALCIGDSGSSETGADRATVKTSDGKLYIPASTLKGIWRHACEAIARGQEKDVCNSPRAESMCQTNHCIICQIFGSPDRESRIFINDLMMATDLVAESTEIRNGVTINRRRRVAEDQRLYFTETSLPNAGFVFSGDVTIGDEVTKDQIELLRAGLNYIHAMGTGKSRGLGWLKITQKDKAVETNSQEASPIAPDSADFTELTIKVTLKSPLITGGRKPTGQAVEAVQYIRGGLIRGAVAKAWLANSEDGEPDADFRQLFLNDGAGIFRNCYPGLSVLPATAVGCKDFSGFLKKGDEKKGEDEKHGIFDTLLEQLAAEKAGWLYQPGCPCCGGRVDAKTGFYEESDQVYQARSLSTRLLTRVAINRHRRVAEDELLYHLTAVDALSADNKKVTLQGSARIPSSLVGRVADTLQKQVQRIGGGSSRGLGRVCVKVSSKCENSEPLDKRIADFNNALEKLWDAYSHLPNVKMDAFEGTYFSIALQSGAILTAADGWQRSIVLTAPMFQEISGCDAEVTLVRSFASSDYVGGWNAAWGLPKETDLATRMGSVFVFHTPDIKSWKPYLKMLQDTCIGNRREEGFGQILICDPFHLRTRENVKCEIRKHKAENKEESK